MFKFRPPAHFGGVNDWSAHITCDDKAATSIVKTYNTSFPTDQDLFIVTTKICAINVKCQVNIYV